MKIIITSSKKLFRNNELVKKLEDKNAIFYEKFGIKISDIKELYNNEPKLLALDEVSIKGGYDSLNKELPQIKDVKFICGLSSRYHEFDLDTAKQKGITYCNNPNTTSESVAQLAIMMMFMLIRNQPLTYQKDFDFYGIKNLGREYQSLTVGILGFGNIGSKIATICDKLDMDIKIWSRTKKDTSYKQVSALNLLKQNIIFIALPVEKETKMIFSKKFFQSLNKSHYIIDIGGNDSLYNKNKLIEMANNKNIAGFGFEAENPKSKYINIGGNIVITPHIGWGTEESYNRLYSGWVKTILSCYKGNPKNVIV